MNESNSITVKKILLSLPTHPHQIKTKPIHLCLHFLQGTRHFQGMLTCGNSFFARQWGWWAYQDVSRTHLAYGSVHIICFKILISLFGKRTKTKKHLSSAHLMNFRHFSVKNTYSSAETAHFIFFISASLNIILLIVTVFYVCFFKPYRIISKFPYAAILTPRWLMELRWSNDSS